MGVRRFRQYLGDWVGAMKLSSKFTALLLVFLAVPVLCTARYTFSGMRDRLLAEQEQIALQTLEYSLRSIQDVVASGNLAVALVAEDWRLLEEMAGLDGGGSVGNGQAARLDGRLDTIARSVDANPDIHALRLYWTNGVVEERPPVLYSRESLLARPWYTTPLFSGRAWRFNVADSMTPSAESYAVRLEELLGPEGNTLGVVEVSTGMGTMFRDLYHQEENRWMGFVDSNGYLYYDKDRELGAWSSVIGSVVYSAAEVGRDSYSTTLSQGRHTILVARVTVPQLSGRLIYAVMLDDGLRQINQARYVFFTVFMLLCFLCAILFHRVVELMLRRFFRLKDIAAEVQRGNLDVEIPDMGGDEIGEFAAGFRDTIEQLQLLLRTSVNRELLVKNTEIRALQNQINSHFIYNVLESIKMMAEIEERYAISDAVTSLGKLLRYSMKWASSMVSLQEELDYIQNYIALLNLRYDFVITLRIDAPPRLLEAKIPKMSLQPIVENAVYHGIEEQEEDAVIRITVKEYGDCFDVELSDTGKGMDQEALELLRKRVYGLVREADRPRGGIGLRNVQERIQLSFGDRYGLRIFSQEHCFTKVVVRLPLDGKGEADETPADCGG